MKISPKAGMAVSAAGIILVALSEGFTSEAVQPLLGDKWTIGFGHTEGVRPGDEITAKEALSLLDRDLDQAEWAVNELVRVPLKQHQFDALVSLVFNIGPGAFGTSTLLRALNAHDDKEVQRLWMRWCYFKGKKNKGLENRRARELAVFLGKPVVEAGRAVCFGRDLCIDGDVLVQERAQGPDGAQDS